jgi:hypothetical protein
MPDAPTSTRRGLVKPVGSDELIDTTKADRLMVKTIDGVHHESINSNDQKKPIRIADLVRL